MAVAVSLKQAMFEHLTTTTNIVNIVDRRIFSLIAPQGAKLPYVVFNRTATDHVRYMVARAMLVRTTIQFECFAASVVELENLTDKIKLALDMFGGVMGTVSALRVLRSFVTSWADGEEVLVGDTEPAFRSSITVEVLHEET